MNREEFAQHAVWHGAEALADVREALAELAPLPVAFETAADGGAESVAASVDSMTAAVQALTDLPMHDLVRRAITQAANQWMGGVSLLMLADDTGSIGALHAAIGLFSYASEAVYAARTVSRGDLPDADDVASNEVAIIEFHRPSVRPQRKPNLNRQRNRKRRP